MKPAKDPLLRFVAPSYTELQLMFKERHFMGHPIVGNSFDPEVVMVTREWYERLKDMVLNGSR